MRPVRTIAAAVLAFALAGPEAPRADPPRRPEPAPLRSPAPPPGADRVEILVRFPPWEFSGTFRAVSASGALGDLGAVRDVGALLVSGTPVERILQGERGTLTLRLHGVRNLPGFPPIFGRWAVVRGTGWYEGLRGEGTFTAVGAGEGKGGPFEVQTLLGHVYR
ncbi:MAG TPA: hypothetical protein VD838_01040 [Anaeromyxobacteraceae bacterium]|nr:hypothetical protein [Anaeromyxobacteraceae bacterium]